MKRKVGELYNVPIVEGDPNLLKSNEILHKGGGQLSKRNNTGKIEDLGNSDSGEGGGSNIEYFKVSDIPSGKPTMGMTLCSIGVKLQAEDGNIYIAAPSMLSAFNIKGTALGYMVLPDMKVYIEGMIMTTREYFNTVAGQGSYDALPRITEEEFYNLNA